MKLEIELSRDLVEALETLARSQATPQAPPAAIVLYLLRSMADGIRRPGSWERQCVDMLFGPIGLPPAPPMPPIRTLKR